MTPLLTIIISAAAAFIIGFLIHGPIAGKLWMRLANIQPTGNEKFSDMIPQMAWNFVANLVTAGVLYAIIDFTAPLAGGLIWYRGALVAIWMWFGFIVPSSAMEVIWLKRRPAHWIFECVSSLLCFIAMGIISTL